MTRIAAILQDDEINVDVKKKSCEAGYHIQPTRALPLTKQKNKESDHEKILEKQFEAMWKKFVRQAVHSGGNKTRRKHKTENQRWQDEYRSSFENSSNSNNSEFSWSSWVEDEHESFTTYGKSRHGYRSTNPNQHYNQYEQPMHPSFSVWSHHSVKQHLTTLGLSVGENKPPPTALELKKAFYKLAMKHHPDRHHSSSNTENGSAESAERMFKKAQEAYDSLLPLIK